MSTTNDTVNKTNRANIRHDSDGQPLYFSLKDARRTARDSERHGQLSADEQRLNPHWKSVRKQCEALLSDYDDDIEIACWYTESLLRLEGLAGLLQGFDTLHNMIQALAQNSALTAEEKSELLHPFASLNGVDRPGTLIEPISWISLTNAPETEQSALWQYQQALIHKNNDELRLIKQAMNATPAAFLQSWQQNINAITTRYNDMTHLMDQACGSHAPPTSNIKNALQDLAHHFHMLSKDNLPAQTVSDDSVEPSGHDDSALPETTTPQTPSRQGWTRNSALQTLLDISDFFAVNEPHSPISYLLQRTVNWANLSLAELLPLLVKDESSRKEIFNLTGIQDPTTTGDTQ